MVYRWANKSGSSIKTIESLAADNISQDAVTAITYSQDGSLFASSVMDHTVTIRRASDGSIIQKLCAEDTNVRECAVPPKGKCLAFSPTGTRLVSALDRWIYVWSTRTGKLLKKLDAYLDDVRGPICALEWSPDGRWIAAGCADGQVCLWDTPAGYRLLRKFQNHLSDIRFVLFSPDSHLLVSGGAAGGWFAWNVDLAAYDPERRLSDEQIDTGEPLNLRSLWTYNDRHDPSKTVWGARFDTKGERLVTYSDDGTARVWAVSTWEMLGILGTDYDPVRSAVFSPDDTRVLTASDDHTMTIWDAYTGAPLHTLSGHSGAVYCAEYSPDGEAIVSASADATVRLWRASDGAHMQTFEEEDEVRLLQFSPRADARAFAYGVSSSVVFMLDPTHRSRLFRECGPY